MQAGKQYKAVDKVPNSRDRLHRNLRLGIIVFDLTGRISDIQSAPVARVCACKRLQHQSCRPRNNHTKFTWTGYKIQHSIAEEVQIEIHAIIDSTAGFW